MKNQIKLITLVLLLTGLNSAWAADVRTEIMNCQTELAAGSLSGGPVTLSTPVYPAKIEFCRDEMAKVKSQNKKQVITGFAVIKDKVRTKVEESSLPAAAGARTLHLCDYDVDTSRIAVRMSTNNLAEAKNLCAEYCKRYSLVLDGKEMNCHLNVINETAEGGRSIASTIELPF